MSSQRSDPPVTPDGRYIVMPRGSGGAPIPGSAVWRGRRLWMPW